jgi:hypothetical protein
LEEFKGLLIILGSQDIPIVPITQIVKHTVKFRAGINEERLAGFVACRSRSRERGHQFFPAPVSGRRE